VDEKIEVKYEEILDHLQSALHATEDDEKEFRKCTEELEQMVGQLKVDKSDRTELEELKRHVGTVGQGSAAPQASGMGRDELEEMVRLMVSLKADRSDLEQLKSQLGSASASHAGAPVSFAAAPGPGQPDVARVASAESAGDAVPVFGGQPGHQNGSAAVAPEANPASHELAPTYGETAENRGGAAAAAGRRPAPDASASYCLACDQPIPTAPERTQHAPRSAQARAGNEPARAAAVARPGNEPARTTAQPAGSEQARTAQPRSEPAGAAQPSPSLPPVGAALQGSGGGTPVLPDRPHVTVPRAQSPQLHQGDEELVEGVDGLYYKGN